ncbi:MAG: B12-binding domain-containing radical SAM protein, partial [Clostridia bacterium]|nr:B12-binding domain-containing radical SAM protein [Clostridia bacterium]
MDIKEYLYKVEKPTRYIGNEFNIPDMNKPCKVRFCMCFPDVYEIAMSNIGIQILYSMLNDDKDIVCERCFAPWLDLGSILKEKNIALGSIETGRDLKDFDIVGFSVPYEMSYTNILYMLDLAKIPFRAKDRDNSYPLIVGGGPASANPEPIIDFFDAFFIGDGEESDIEFCNIVKKYKGDKD